MYSHATTRSLLLVVEIVTGDAPVPDANRVMLWLAALGSSPKLLV
jgi:hypothetical protein